MLLDRPSDSYAKELAGASPEFRQGWADGCETGMSAGSNAFYRMYYKSNKADGYKMFDSADYKAAWGNSFWYCYRKDEVKLGGTIHGSMFKGLQ